MALQLELRSMHRCLAVVLMPHLAQLPLQAGFKILSIADRAAPSL